MDISQHYQLQQNSQANMKPKNINKPFKNYKVSIVYYNLLKKLINLLNNYVIYTV
jgi:hypothetical protein